jgi:dTDP-4-dehydrorhamnose reductase
MRVFVTGAAGQVGTDLVSALHGVVPVAGAATALLGGDPVREDEFEVVAATHAALAVDDAHAVTAAISAARPDVVVHLAAFTAVDRAEQEPDEARRVNTDGTANVAAATRAAGAHLVYVSTDYVFDGSKTRAYVEGDEPNPKSVYGATKLGGELACDESTTIARVSWVSGFHGRNIVRLATERALRGEPMRFVDDQRGCPSFAADPRLAWSRSLGNGRAGSCISPTRERPPGTGWSVVSSSPSVAIPAP